MGVYDGELRRSVSHSRTGSRLHSDDVRTSLDTAAIQNVGHKRLSRGKEAHAPTAAIDPEKQACGKCRGRLRPLFKTRNAGTGSTPFQGMFLRSLGV